MRGFPKEEFINRVVKLRQLMEKKHVDAIIITSPSICFLLGSLTAFFDSISLLIIRPLGPDPLNFLKSMFCSFAIFLAKGDTFNLSFDW